MFFIYAHCLPELPELRELPDDRHWHRDIVFEQLSTSIFQGDPRLSGLRELLHILELLRRHTTEFTEQSPQALLDFS
jgi:hypothetical protein